MSNTFKWSVQKLRVAPQQGDKANVVVQADWLCVALNNESIVQAAASGVKSFTLGDSFTPFNQLTEAQVTGQIARQLAQKESEPALPWV